MRLCDYTTSTGPSVVWKLRRGERQPVEEFPTGYYVPFLQNVEVKLFACMVELNNNFYACILYDNLNFCIYSNSSIQKKC